MNFDVSPKETRVRYNHNWIKRQELDIIITCIYLCLRYVDTRIDNWGDEETRVRYNHHMYISMSEIRRYPR